MKFYYEKKTISFTSRRGHSLGVAAHLHRELELVFVVSGNPIAYSDSVRCELHAGDIFLTFANQIHSYETIGPEDYYLYIIKPDLMPELLETFTTAVPQTPVIRGGLYDPTISFLRDRLDAVTADHDNPYREAIQRGYLLALFSEILLRMPVTKLPTGDSGALRAIISYCSNHFTENLSLALLEEKLHLNRYYISHLFTGKLAIRFNDYINALRISEACRYLLFTDLSVTEISDLVGFNTLRTFNRAFIKQIKLSPSEYRKKDFDVDYSTITIPAKGENTYELPQK